MIRTGRGHQQLYRGHQQLARGGQQTCRGGQQTCGGGCGLRGGGGGGSAIVVERLAHTLPYLEKVVVAHLVYRRDLDAGGVERVVSLLADVVGIYLYHSALLHGLGGGVPGSGYGYLGVEQQLGLIVEDVIQCAHAVTLIGRHATLMKDDKRQVVGMQSVYKLVHHRAVSFLL